MKRLVRALDTVADRINPIVIKEVRQAVQSRFIIGLLLLFLLVNVGIIAMFALSRDAIEQQNLSAGRELFEAMLVVLAIACVGLVPLRAGVVFNKERSGTNMDLLYVTTIKAGAIVRGKFWAAMIVSILIVSVCAPFLSFTYLLRGISLPVIFFMLGVCLLASAAVNSLAIFLSTAKTGNMGGLFTLIVLAVGCLGGVSAVIGISSGLVQYGGSFMDEPDFWRITGMLVGMTLLGMGLFYVFAVAILSPKSSNRMIGVRSYMLFLWLAYGAGMAYYSLMPSITDHVPMMSWYIGAFCMFTLSLLIAVSERESWSPRVARQIPRWRVLRLPAFLFYSGSAGGTLWSLLLAGLTILIGHWWLENQPGLSNRSEMKEVLRVTPAAFGYVYCYCMTAVMVRKALLKKVPHQFTSMIALLLMVFGCIMPMLIVNMAYPEHSYMSRLSRQPYRYWMLTHPSALDDKAFFPTVMMFLVIWGGIVTLACLPWFVGQFKKFSPPKRDEKPADAVTDDG